MSRLGDEGIPCACEADILGAMSMHACLLASGSPAALADWNNLHSEDEELANVWHCGVFPASFGRRGRRSAITRSWFPRARRRQARGMVELVAKPCPADALPDHARSGRGVEGGGGRGPFRGQSGGDLRRLRLVPHRQFAAALPRRAAAALPPSRGPDRVARGQRDMGSAGQLPGHGSLPCHPGDSGACTRRSCRSDRA